MASGNGIVVKSPYGKKIEGIVSGALKPGQLVQLQSGTAAVNGKFTFEAKSGDGLAGEVLILDIDSLQGKTADDAYADGDNCFIWAPGGIGDEFNVLKVDISGTGSALEDLSVGEELKIVEGKVSAADVPPVPAVKPFKSLEALVDQDGDTLVHAMFTGNN